MTRPLSDEQPSGNQGRKVAARNRVALIAAAREIYAEHGLDAPLSAIARRAGVGQGVLYRHFPDRAAIGTAVLEENVRQIEQVAAADASDIVRILGVLTWHVTESTAFLGILHTHGASSRSSALAYAAALSKRVEQAVRARLPGGHRLAGHPDDLMIAIAMVSGAATGPTREHRERRAQAAWRLLGVEVGPVRPYEE